MHKFYTKEIVAQLFAAIFFTVWYLSSTRIAKSSKASPLCSERAELLDGRVPNIVELPHNLSDAKCGNIQL